MNRLHSTLIATACLALAAACQKHQEPIGTVPADDVPAVPAGNGAGQGPTTMGEQADTGSSAAGGMDQAAAGGTGHDAVGGSEQGAAACEAMIGAEREACMRSYPSSTPTSVEPQRNQPPQPVN
jgi:hypothetical protein